MDPEKPNEDKNGFLFPFKPYGIQLKFMESLYDVLQNCNIGIFESPTGTGKSLSIICGSMKWLTDFQIQRKKDLQEQVQKQRKYSTASDWFSSYIEEKEKCEQSYAAKEELEFIERRLNRIAAIKQAVGKGYKKDEEKSNFGFRQPIKKLKLDNDENGTGSNEEEDFLIKDCDENYENPDCFEEKSVEIMKIFYASRTHSQLLQFMNEFKKTAYSKTVTVTCLGSRGALCVNGSVRKLKSHHLINEKCSELLSIRSQAKGNKMVKGAQCTFYKKSNIKALQDHIVSEPHDIEDLASLGSALNACPYYATRNVVNDIEMVMLPYNILLHKTTRESCGIKLKGNIVIIDEAHNLLDAINNMYSSELHGDVLQESQNLLNEYKNKYRKRFSPKTTCYINVLFQILESFLKYMTLLYLESQPLSLKNMESNITVISMSEFLSIVKLDHINFFDVVRFCEESHIGPKLHGFAIKGSKISNNSQPSAQFLNAILKSCKSAEAPIENTVKFKYPLAFFSFIEFLRVFTLPQDCGKIVCCKATDVENSYYKLLHMNPSIHFTDIVKEARSVILAGGTMSPISEFVNQLLVPSGACVDKIHHYSYGHVVADSNVNVMCLYSGLNNTVFDFKYESRQHDSVLRALGDFLVRITQVVPGGIVCFFPSYNYEKLVYSFILKEKLITEIEKNKLVFREMKQSDLSEDLLTDYSNAIRSPKGKKGAMLFCIVGGKMSEGINFSDDLCRCVVMVGMPYAKKDKIYMEKLKYFKVKFGESVDNYTQMCMKAVNQSIGRAIRHKNDYAVIVLLDHRYYNSNVLACLPAWLSKVSRFDIDEAISSVQDFFSNLSFS